MQDIESDMRNLVAEIIEKAPSEIKSDDRLIEDLGVDSMMALEILAGIEKKYKITIPEEKLAEFITLGSIIAIAKEYLSTNA
jgi:acyl carrier protein